MAETSTSATHQVARNVRAELARKDCKQSSLAIALRMSQASISDRLTGKTPIDVDELVVIADFLDVSLGCLLDGVRVDRPALAVAAVTA